MEMCSFYVANHLAESGVCFLPSAVQEFNIKQRNQNILEPKRYFSISLSIGV